MKAVAEHLEISKNNFSKWLFLFFTLMSVFAFFISINDTGNGKWISLGGIVLFGFGYWSSLRSRIDARQDGFILHTGFKQKDVLWKDITTVMYDVVYHGHGMQLHLTIEYGSPAKTIAIPVKLFKKRPMQRFFEILNEQCPLATKNDHFIKQATGEMGWKDKLKMY
jgi:hypothetical protein